MQASSWQKVMAWGVLDVTGPAPLRAYEHPVFGHALSFRLRIEAYAARKAGGVEIQQLSLPCVIFGDAVPVLRPILQECIGFDRKLHVEGTLAFVEKSLALKVDYLLRIKEGA